MTAAEFKTALAILGWSQAEAARRLEVTQGAVSRWISGKRKIPGPVKVILGGKVKYALRATASTKQPG